MLSEHEVPDAVDEAAVCWEDDVPQQQAHRGTRCILKVAIAPLDPPVKHSSMPVNGSE